jgi:hypothetical protein
VPKPRWMPLPGLLSAQVLKQYRRKRIGGVKHRVVFGTREAVEQALGLCRKVCSGGREGAVAPVCRGD